MALNLLYVILQRKHFNFSLAYFFSTFMLICSTEHVHIFWLRMQKGTINVKMPFPRQWTPTWHFFSEYTWVWGLCMGVGYITLSHYIITCIHRGKDYSWPIRLALAAFWSCNQRDMRVGMRGAGSNVCLYAGWEEGGGCIASRLVRVNRRLYGVSVQKGAVILAILHIFGHNSPSLTPWGPENLEIGKKIPTSTCKTF